MIAELLLVLAGHESSLFPDDHKLHPDFVPLVHPGERECLESLGLLAFRYRRIKAASARLSSSPSTYICAFCAKLNAILRDEYESLVCSTEARILTRDDSLVGSGSFVPLSSIRAIFLPWDNPLSAIESVITRIEQEPNWPPGRLIDLLIDRSEAGTHNISSIMSRLASAVQQIWRSHLQAFLIHGVLSPTDPLADDKYNLRNEVIPSCVSQTSRDSIKYVGRAVGTVKSSKWKKQLPSNLLIAHTRLLDSVLPQDHHAFDRVIAQIRSEVSEWLWSNVLTMTDVESAVVSLADYFLLQNGEFSLSLIREVDRLKQSRLNARSGPKSSIIREQDLQLALLRASLGTSAQHDPALAYLRFQLPSGHARPLLPDPTLRAPSSSVNARFDDVMLGTSVRLAYDIAWPLDLFLHDVDLTIYADIFAFLSGLRHIHNRVHGCWTSLSGAQRARRRWTGLGEGGTQQDFESRKDLLRCGWGLVRLMGWFLDVLLSYMMLDVVESEFQTFKKKLRPADGKQYIDFSTLRHLHSTYLERLLNCSLLSQSSLTTTIRGIFDICDQFVGQVERWGGDVLPALLAEGSLVEGDESSVGKLVLERWEIVKEINENFNNLLKTLYGQLTSATTLTGAGAGDVSRSTSITASGSLLASSTNGNRKQRSSENEGETRRRVERLLLRMDFNRMFSKIS